MPAVLAKLSEDVVRESEGTEAISISGIRHGIKETAGFFEALAADYTNPQLTISDYVPSGDKVMTLGRYQATMKATGKLWDSPIAPVSEDE